MKMMIKRITDQGVTIDVSHEDLLRMENVTRAYTELRGEVDASTYMLAEDFIIECASVRREMDRVDRLMPIDVYKA